MSISQKDGVFNAVVAFIEESGRKFEEGMKVELSSSDRKTVIGMLVAATEANELDVKSDGAKNDLKTYWNGTLSNWLRKDKRLNGGVKYETKNPGSRAGSGDKELQELRKLLTQVQATGIEENIKAVQDAIDVRLAKIQAAKAPKFEVDKDKLPEGVRHLA